MKSRLKFNFFPFVFAFLCPIIPTPFVEKMILSLLKCFCSRVKISWPYVGLFLDSLLYSVDYVSIPFLVPYWLNYCTLVLKSDSVVPPNWFFFKIVLVILVSLPLHMHIRISLYIPKISAGIWLELCSIISNCAITSSSLWRINVFTMLSLPVCEHMSLHLFTSSLFLMSAFYSFQCTDPYMLH